MGIETETPDLDNALGGGSTSTEPIVDKNGPDAIKAAEAAKAQKDAADKAKAETPEAKAAAAKKAEEDAAAKKLADDAKAKDIEVKFGDLPVDEKVVGKFKDIAKNLKLDSAGAQQLADLFVEARKAEDAGIKTALEQQNKKWQETNKADKDFGGAAFATSVLNARKVIEKFGPEFKAALAGEYAFLSNYPPLVKMLARLGKANAEDSVGDGGSTGKPALTEDERLAKQYPKGTAQQAARAAGRGA